MAPRRRRRGRALGVAALAAALAWGGLPAGARAQGASPIDFGGASGGPPADPQAVFCAACRAVPEAAAAVVAAKERKLGRENAVTEALDYGQLCTTSSFKTYAFSPPTMVGGCRKVLDKHEEALEALLFEGAAPGAIFEKLCGRKCAGVKVPGLPGEEL